MSTDCQYPMQKEFTSKDRNHIYGIVLNEHPLHYRTMRGFHPEHKDYYYTNYARHFKLFPCLIV